MAPTVVEIETPHGLARAHLHAAREAEGSTRTRTRRRRRRRGARSGRRRATLRSQTGLTVALVEQPYRRRRTTFSGARGPARRGLDRGSGGSDREPPLRARAVVGGRSAGARVACRTAAGNRAPSASSASRSHSCRRVERKPAACGFPSSMRWACRRSWCRARRPLRHPSGGSAGRRSCVVRGDHGLRTDLDAVGAAVPILAGRGRSPSHAATITRPAGIPEWPKGAGCKPAGSAFGGSNPPPCIRRERATLRNPRPLSSVGRHFHGTWARQRQYARCCQPSQTGRARRPPEPVLNGRF